MDEIKNVNSQHSYARSLVPMIVIGVLFFMFGFVTWLNGALIPFLQIACELNSFQSYLVTMAFYIAYTIMALPLSMILQRTGFKKGMLIGLAIMVVGSLLFIPAALMREFMFFLVALFVLGAGLTILQTASNPYIILIGPQDSAAVRISVMGVLNKFAGVLAPIVFSALVFSGVSAPDETVLEAMSVSERDVALTELASHLIIPYLCMAAMLVLIALFVWLSPLPEPDEEKQDDQDARSERLRDHPRLILGAIAVFFYVGAEVVAGDTIGIFGLEAGVDNFVQLTSYTMAFMVAGYLLGIATIPRFLSQVRALVLCSFAGITLTVLLLSASVDSFSVWNALFAWTGVPPVPDPVLFIALYGFANALIWPAIWPLALEGLSAHMTRVGSALLIMGIAGGAVIPPLYGAVADVTADSQSAYWIMIPCYLYVLFFAYMVRETKVVR